METIATFQARVDGSDQCDYFEKQLDSAYIVKVSLTDLLTDGCEV